MLPLSVLRETSAVRDASGRRVVLPSPRIGCLLLAGPARHPVNAWLDTGSPLTIIPEEHWSEFEPSVTWVDAAGEGISCRLAGATHLCRRGRVDLSVASSESAVVLPPTPVLVLCARDGGTLKQALVGLAGGVLAGRRLVVEPDLAAARLEAA